MTHSAQCTCQLTNTHDTTAHQLALSLWSLDASPWECQPCASLGMTVWPCQQLNQATLHHPETCMGCQGILQHPGHHLNCLSYQVSCCACVFGFLVRPVMVAPGLPLPAVLLGFVFCPGTWCTVTIVFRLITYAACTSNLKGCITHTIMCWLRCILHGLHLPTWLHLHAWLHLISYWVHLRHMHPMHDLMMHTAAAVGSMLSSSMLAHVDWQHNANTMWLTKWAGW